MPRTKCPFTQGAPLTMSPYTKFPCQNPPLQVTTTLLGTFFSGLVFHNLIQTCCPWCNPFLVAYIPVLYHFTPPQSFPVRIATLHQMFLPECPISQYPFTPRARFSPSVLAAVKARWRCRFSPANWGSVALPFYDTRTHNFQG